MDKARVAPPLVTEGDTGQRYRDCGDRVPGGRRCRRDARNRLTPGPSHANVIAKRLTGSATAPLSGA